MPHKPVSFLIVDDDVVSIMSMKRTITKLRLLNPVKEARDGIEALEILRNTNQPEGLQSPFIVILDLNMPRMSGHELMKEVRSDPALRDTVIFVMSTSDSPVDVQNAYAANAAGYILKDGSPNSFREALTLLGAYSEVVVLPEISAA